jgi:RsiW-degrading membrane proteinase PrsW (M82 family)
MTRDGRDPVAARSADSEDLYGVADWEVRTAFDRLVYWLYYGFYLTVRVGVVLAAVAILAAQFVLGGLGAVADPVLGVFTVLSAVPALALAAYVWDADVTTQEPLHLLVATFVLGVLFASFAGVLNGEIGDPIRNVASLGGAVPLLGSVVFFYLVVGPVEETVKLLAVRLFAFRSDRFDAVVDGAVYGAVAGLGFATIENALYITQNADAGLQATNALTEAGGIAVVRTLAGPGHVIYSAFAGYYLGLAKFNREHAGPIVLKGLVIAAFVHATYNTLVGIVPGIVTTLTGVSPLVAFFGFVVVYDSVFGLLLIRKIRAYARAYRNANPSPTSYESEPTEFDP